MSECSARGDWRRSSSRSRTHRAGRTQDTPNRAQQIGPPSQRQVWPALLPHQARAVALRALHQRPRRGQPTGVAGRLTSSPDSGGDRRPVARGTRHRSVYVFSPSTPRRPAAAATRDPQAVPVGVLGLGAERVKTLTIHHGRHTFVSHTLAGGRSLAEVRGCRAGHSNVAVTSAYLHVVVDDDEPVGHLFGEHEL